MGEATRRKRSETPRRAQFFAEHPVCCFCGGHTPASTEDHVPNRAIFDERKWPEGYNFPACEPCNSITRADENILALLSRMTPTRAEPSEIERREVRKAMRAVHNNFPDAFTSMALSPNEVRLWLRNRGLSKPPNTLLSDIPLVSVGHPRFQQAIKRFGTKLFCALHYKHTRKVVPHSHTVAGHWFSNVQLNDGAIPSELLKVLGSTVQLVRAKNDLQDQFFYRYAVTPDASTSAFFCAFRATFALTGIVTPDELPAAFDEDLEHGRFKARPFARASPSAA